MEDTRKPRKKRYTRPEVRKVRLDATVLLAKGCKTSSGSAKAGNICNTFGYCKAASHGS